MSNGEPTANRLDRMEAIMERMIESIQNHDRTLDRLESLQSADRESMLQLTNVVQLIAEQVQLTAERVQLMVEQAERDRNQAAIDRAEFRSTVQDILATLSERFSSNGHD